MFSHDNLGMREDITDGVLYILDLHLGRGTLS